MKPFDAVIDAPFGKVGIRADENAVREIVYLPADTSALGPLKPLVLAAATQIYRYFEDPSMRFDLQLSTRGTDHQKRVWRGISGIESGQVWTYGQLAREIGSVARVVGQACSSNPLPIVIPCHRVVASNGIGGFAHHPGDGFFRDVKRWLLAHEGVSIA
ncbi:Methylated-DNA--protein-cysteine methyltransferase [Candidatus Burkholderia pumila]|uniref:Methylated-DNA--protein-cysteine methyltransferase n=1 Tax=Candidatus Burkholderia pumila TaxID=1090375 RepID=A0ABR5HML6_9BURK|nr:Methylated-DNA--protein-cysteine methyltransferase [Candidatus Burkholderia pumila]